MTLALQELLQKVIEGDWLGVVDAVYTDLIGAWFYAFILLLTHTMIYLKTRDIGVVTVIGIISSAVMLAVLPAPAQTVAFVFMVLFVGLAVARAVLR